MPKTNPKPHSFVIKDADLFAQGRTERDLRTLVCEECGEQPGRGVHVPPPPPLHMVVVDEVATTLASVSGEFAGNVRREAAKVAFTTVQQIRKALEEMSKLEKYVDPYEGGGSVFSDIDAELDGLLTQLRRQGWDQ